MTKEPISIGEDALKQFSPEEQYLLRPLKSAVINMEAVVKFHTNQQESQIKKNPFVSWTLNKIAVIDKNWLQQFKTDQIPIRDGDFWRIKIEHETSPGQPLGCFIVRPLWRIERKDLVPLAPSTFSKVQQGLTVLLYPKIRPWLPWIIPKALRQMIMRTTGGAALVIPLSYPPEKEISARDLASEELPVDSEEISSYDVVASDETLGD
jgi:hypothetical protein